MCAQFRLKISFKDLLKKLGVETQKTTESKDEIDDLFVPYTPAPVVVDDRTAGRTLKPMKFSLVPAWSKEPKVKFATHNARLLSADDEGNVVRIYEKATWKQPFKFRHCLVPMSAFIEPIYSGEFAGTMLQFFPKDRTLLVAAGIWEEWTDKKTGEIVDSFAILTHDPYPFVKDMGHDRCPVFLGEEEQAAWLKLKEDPKEMLDTLLNTRVSIHFDTNVERKLKAGWEKRR